MKSAYRGIAYLIALGVVAQASFIALGWFLVMSDLDGGAVVSGDDYYNSGHILHAAVGSAVIPLLAIILTIVSFFTKVTGASKRAGLVLLATVVQVLLAFVAFGVPAVGALHGINALILFSLAVFAARLFPFDRRAEAGTASTAGTAAGAGTMVPGQGSRSESSTV